MSTEFEPSVVREAADAHADLQKATEELGQVLAYTHGTLDENAQDMLSAAHHHVWSAFWTLDACKVHLKPESDGDE